MSPACSGQSQSVLAASPSSSLPMFSKSPEVSLELDELLDVKLSTFLLAET